MIEIDFPNLRRIGLTQHTVSQLGALQLPSSKTLRLLRIVETQRDEFTLHDGIALHRAKAFPRLLRELADASLAIGDWVVADTDPAGDLWIAVRLAPFSQIARRANDGRRQVLASNVDTALLVMGLDADFNPRRAERYIAMVRACEVQPVMVLTKLDAAAGAQAHVEELRARLPASLPVLAVNGTSEAARIALSPWLRASQTLVLLGSSGAGKSTLTNTLAGAPLQATGGLRHGDGRGRHTTTARSLHACADGACIIDTPGLRTWRPDADADTLAATYEDVASLAAQCRFRDCTHQGEPGCAVRGQVGADRLLNMHKLMRDAQRAEQTPLDRIAQRQKWKRLGKAGAARARDKRG